MYRCSVEDGFNVPVVEWCRWVYYELSLGVEVFARLNKKFLPKSQWGLAPLTHYGQGLASRLITA